MNKINILITGSKGFIGRNILKKLQLNESFNIFEFNRDDDLHVLKLLLAKSDFIFHFAGEVRPTSSDDEFNSSNTTLTQEIIDILVKMEKKTPILYSSSIHAELQKNSYGKSKRESELIIENYANLNGSKCWIYRLPHVFGEGCKANYNSVISTWIYNSLNDLDINVYDREITMKYVYVQDIIDEFIDLLGSNKSDELYLNPKKVFNTTLGEVKDLILEFKEVVKLNKNNYIRDEFKHKLFTVYLDYYNKMELVDND